MGRTEAKLYYTTASLVSLAFLGMMGVVILDLF